MIRLFFRDSLIYVIPAIVSRGLAIFLIPLYTRVLSPADYGALDMLLVFGSLANLTVAFEVAQGLARHYIDEKSATARAEYAATALWFTAGCYALFFAVGQIFAGFFSHLLVGVTGFDNAFRIGIGYIACNGLFLLIQGQFRWQLRAKDAAITSLVNVLVTATFSVLLAFVWKLGLIGLLTGMTIGVVSGCGYGAVRLTQSFRARFHPGRLKAMLTYSAPLVPSGIAVFLSQYIDRLMIRHFLPLEQLGIFAIGFRLASVIWLVMVGFQGAITPLVYSQRDDPATPGQLAVIFRIFCGLALTVFLGLSLYSREALKILTNPQYYAADSLVIFLVPAILLAQMYIFAPGIGIAKKTHLILAVNVGSALINIVANLLLLPLLGIVGAAIATLLASASSFTAMFFLSQKYYPVPYPWRRIGFAVILTSIVVVTGRMVDLPLLPAIGVKTLFFGVGLAFLIMTGIFKWQELSQLRGLIGAKMRSKA